MDKQTILKKFMDFLDSVVGDVSSDKTIVEVTKSLDDEQRRALFVVLEPDVVDLHGDTYTAEEVEKACVNFNTHCMKANLFHKIETENAVIEQSFITPASFTTDTGKEIKKGAWLSWFHFPEGNEISDALWESVKTGDVNGVSIGARAVVEEIE